MRILKIRTMPDARFKKMIRVSKPLSTHTPTFNRAHTKSIQLRKYYSTFVIIRIILIIFIIDEIFSFHFFTSKFTRSAELSVNLVIEKSCGERVFFARIDTKLLTNTLFFDEKHTDTL